MTRIGQKNRRGFTLIELLVVCGMMAVISLAVFSSLSSGIRLWQRLGNLKMNEDLNIFLERFSADVANSFEFSAIGFQGKDDSLDMPALVKSQFSRKDIPGKVAYAYDRQNRALTRSQMDYSQIYQDSRVTPKQSLTGVNSCKFSYRVLDNRTKKYYWSEESLAGRLPESVRLELGLDQESGGYIFNRTVSVPVSEAVK